MKAWKGHGERESWKAGTGATVGEPTFLIGDQRSREKTLAKMKLQYFNGVYDCRKRNCPIPLQKQRYVAPQPSAKLRIRGKSVYCKPLRDHGVGQFVHKLYM